MGYAQKMNVKLWTSFYLIPLGFNPFKKIFFIKGHPSNPLGVGGLGPEAPQISYGSAINQSSMQSIKDQP
jgi:hypothetical protein